MLLVSMPEAAAASLEVRLLFGIEAREDLRLLDELVPTGVVNREVEVRHGAAQVEHDLVLPLGIVLAVVDQIVVGLNDGFDVREHAAELGA